jgi:hypothetical protein
MKLLMLLSLRLLLLPHTKVQIFSSYIYKIIPFKIASSSLDLLGTHLQGDDFQTQLVCREQPVEAMEDVTGDLNLTVSQLDMVVVRRQATS